MPTPTIDELAARASEASEALERAVSDLRSHPDFTAAHLRGVAFAPRSALLEYTPEEYAARHNHENKEN